MGYSPWGCKESDTSEHKHTHTHTYTHTNTLVEQREYRLYFLSKSEKSCQNKQHLSGVLEKDFFFLTKVEKLGFSGRVSQIFFCCIKMVIPALVIIERRKD